MAGTREIDDLSRPRSGCLGPKAHTAAPARLHPQGIGLHEYEGTPQVWAKREPNWDAVGEHEKRMLEGTRAHRLRELPEDQAMTQADLAWAAGHPPRPPSPNSNAETSTPPDALRKYVDAIAGNLLVEVELGN